MKISISARDDKRAVLPAPPTPLVRLQAVSATASLPSVPGSAPGIPDPEVPAVPESPAAVHPPSPAAGVVRHRTAKITPHLQVKNERADQFADVLAGTYEELFTRMCRGFKAQDQVWFETAITASKYETHLTATTDCFDYVRQHAQTVWRQATIAEVDGGRNAVDPADTIGITFRLRHHFFLSLKTDRRLQETPLAELLEISRFMADGDRIVIQFGFQAAEDGWIKDADEARATFEAKRPKWWREGRELSDATKHKTAAYGFDFCLRVAVTSPDARRRERFARGVALALKQLNHDNELVEERVQKFRMKGWVQAFNECALPVPLIGRRQILSGAEIAHFVKLPQRALQEEFPIIDNVSKPETMLPEELFQSDLPGIDIGTVTEKGSKRTARYPLAPYAGVAEKYIWDSYCLPEFVFGEMGSGKTGEAIHRAHSAICLGQTVFFFDSADGAACRELHDALPADYPEEKIIHLDLTNKAWPIALNWAFKPAAAGGDAELEAEQAREAGKAFLRQFISGMATDPFTTRMDRVLAVAARAAGAAPFDLELALTSPSYREEMMRRPDVAALPEVIAELEALQDKARREATDVSVDGIMSRLRVLSSDTFRTNLFYQTPRSPLDFRRFADNPEGGYGYCVTIYCDKNSFGPDGQEAIMTFMLAKVLLEGAYSRVDVDQAARRPFVVLLDEPHRFVKGEMATKLGEDAAVELRKYRAKLTMFNHSRDQLGKLWDAFEAGGVQVTMYKSKNVQAFRDMAPIIAPLDPVDAWSSLGQHEAVVTRKLPSKKEVSFIAKMAPPPPAVKDRSARRESCARQFGAPWKDVAAAIQKRRLEYQRRDAVWLAGEKQKERVAKEAAKKK